MTNASYTPSLYATRRQAPVIAATPSAAGGGVIPTSVYTQGDKLYVHANGAFKVIGVMGQLGKVDMAPNYPSGFGKQTDDRWTYDAPAMAKYVAEATNAYPLLQSRVAELERRQADLVAKLKVAQAALFRGDLTPAYTTSLRAEIARSLNAV